MKDKVPAESRAELDHLICMSHEIGFHLPQLFDEQRAFTAFFENTVVYVEVSVLRICFIQFSLYCSPVYIVVIDVSGPPVLERSPCLSMAAMFDLLKYPLSRMKPIFL